MTPAAHHFIAWALQHHYHVWAELHWYSQNHREGGWIEWLAKKQ